MNSVYFFKAQWAILALLPIAAAVIYFWYIYNKEGNVFHSSINRFAAFRKNFRETLAFIPALLRIILLLTLVVVLMQPRQGIEKRELNKKGIDIMLALDISGSMAAQDFKPNRLAAAKASAEAFIDMRRNDRIGLVIFSRNSFTQCPLTFDYGILKEMINEVYLGMIQDGTAIGEGLVTAINRLKNSKAKSKVIILLTDGENNAGDIDPQTAAKIAAELGIKIYAIGIGSTKPARVPVPTPYGTQYFTTQLNDSALKKIAATTGGIYFNAKNQYELKKVYDNINSLEKTELKVNMFYNYKEKFMYVLYAAIGIFLLEIILNTLIFFRVT